jgi:hypothetical protein
MGSVNVRQINSHLQGSGSCYIDGPNSKYRFRISRARTRAGVVEGRFVMGRVPEGAEVKDWVAIPSDAQVELFD